MRPAQSPTPTLTQTLRYTRSGTRQSGFSLVAAIFLIVVLAALAAFAVQLAMSQYQGTTLQLLEARAQAAADAGIEYAANRALHAGGICAANTPVPVTGPGLSGYAVNVSCVASPGHQIYTTPPPTWTSYTAYTLSATATYGSFGQPDYVARTVTRVVTSAPP